MPCTRAGQFELVRQQITTQLSFPTGAKVISLFSLPYSSHKISRKLLGLFLRAAAAALTLALSFPVQPAVSHLNVLKLSDLVDLSWAGWARWEGGIICQSNLAGRVSVVTGNTLLT